jgi:hypothetical protein
MAWRRHHVDDAAFGSLAGALCTPTGGSVRKPYDVAARRIDVATAAARSSRASRHHEDRGIVRPLQ